MVSHILFLAGVAFLACIGAVHLLAWLIVWMNGKGNAVYKVVPIGGEGKNTGDQMSLLYACLQWEANPEQQIYVLYDAGLDSEAEHACEELTRGTGVLFVRSPEELGRLLSK